MTLDDFLIDKRVVERNIKNGKLGAAEYRRRLDALPDLSGSIARASGDGTVVAAASSGLRSGAPRLETAEAPRVDAAEAPRVDAAAAPRADAAEAPRVDAEEAPRVDAEEAPLPSL